MTDAGRQLLATVVDEGDGGVFVVTARNMNDSEKRTLQEQGPVRQMAQDPEQIRELAAFYDEADTSQELERAQRDDSVVAEPMTTISLRLPRSRSELLTRILRSLSDQPPDVLRAVADAVADIRQPPALDESLWGPVPDDAAYIRAAMESANRAERLRRELLDDALTVTQAAERLATSRTDIEERIAAGALLALSDGGTPLLPLWQFSERSSAALSGIDRVRSEFPGDAPALSSWMVQPNDALGGATPRNAVENGDVDAVVAAAHAIGA